MDMRKITLAIVAALTVAPAWAALSPAELAVLGERDPRFAMPEPSAAAQALAARIGKDADVEGFRAMVKLRSAPLLHRAAASYEVVAPRVLPAQLEALIVEHYADEVVRRPLLALLARKLDNYERYPRYTSRRLFDLLHAELKTGKDTLHYAIRIVANDVPGIEAELAALLPSLEAASANEIALFLGTRRHAPSVPALRALHQRIPLEKNSNQALEHATWALLQIGTPDAVQAVLERLRALGKSPDPRAASEVWVALLHITALPPGSRPDYAELRAALPAQLNRSAWEQLVKLIETRKERRGIPDLVQAMLQAPQSDAGINALLSMGEPADWRAARERLGRGDTGLAPERLAALQKRLDVALADTARFLAQRQQNERQQDLQLGQRSYGSDKSRLAPLKAQDPARYAKEWRALIDRRAAEVGAYADLPASVGARGDLAREYNALASFLRFQLRRPDEAIAAYQSAGKLRGPPGSFDMSAIAIADIQRFDKRDAGKAIEQYRAALASLEKAAPEMRSEDARAWVVLRRWLGHEIAYLQSGKPFSARVDREDLGAVQVWLLLATALQEMPNEPIRTAPTLAALPPSQFHLASALAGLFDLPPAAILAFLAKHDPAGYLSAALLTLASDPRAQRGGGAGAKSAAETFFRSRGIRPAAPDARYASPEKTWALFVAAAKKGDAPGMLACFTPGMKSKLEGLFARMPPEELRKMGESFVGFAMQSRDEQYGEALIARQSGEKRTAGFAQFVNDGGEWKIDSL